MTSPVPHKHAAIIKAWADGAIIQHYSDIYLEWRDIHNNLPAWCSTSEYRVKPKPKIKKWRWVVQHQIDKSNIRVTSVFYKDEEDFYMNGGSTFIALQRIECTMVEEEQV